MSDLEFTGGLDFTDAAQSLDQFASEAQARLLDALSLDSFSASLSAAAADAFTEPIAITADASAIPDEISAAVADSAIDVPVSADTAPAASEVSDLVATVDGEGATIEVDADTTAAQTSVDDLSSSITDAGNSASGASGHVHEFGLSTGQLAGVAGLAVGEVGGLREASSLLGERTAVATTGALGLAAGIGELYVQGLKAVSAEERFNAVLGDTAQRVQQVNVGNLNADLFKLTAEMGSTDAATRNAAATIFQFSLNAGASRQGAAQFTDQLFALASRAVALKPSLGDVSDVATSMEVGLGRARSAAQQFGISISQAEINTRALDDTGKSSASELTAYEKSVAGAEIAVQRYGDTLKGTITEGAQNAAIQQRRLTAEFEDELAALGKPLVAPALDLIKSAIPVATDLGHALADVASVAIPILRLGLDVLGPAIEPVVVGFIAMKAAALGAAGLGALAGGLEVVAGTLPAVTLGSTTSAAALETLAGGAASASIAVGSLASSALPAAVAGFIAYKGTLAGLNALHDQIFGANHTFADTLKEEGDAARIAAEPTGDLVLKFNDVIRAAASSARNFTPLEARLEAFRQIAEQNVTTAARLADQFPKTSDTYRGMEGILKQLTAAQHESASAADDQAASTSGQNLLLGTAVTSIAAFHDGAGSAATALKDLSAAQKEETDAISLYNTQLERTQAIQGDVTAAQIALGDATLKFNEALFQNGANFDISTEAGRANVTALQAQLHSADQLAEATYKSEVATKGDTAARQDADAVLQFFKASLDNTLYSLGLSTEQVEALNTQLGLVTSPPPVVVTVDASQALAALSPVLSALDKVFAASGNPLAFSIPGDFVPGIGPGFDYATYLRDVAKLGAGGGYQTAVAGGAPWTIGEAGVDEVVVSPRDLPSARANLARLGVLDQLAAPVYAQGGSASSASSGWASHTTDNSVHVDTIVAPSPEDVPRAIARKQRAMQYLGGR